MSHESDHAQNSQLRTYNYPTRKRKALQRAAVAIKILPDATAADADCVSRFERRAKALAALTRPNIAALFGLERSDGPHAARYGVVGANRRSSSKKLNARITVFRTVHRLRAEKLDADPVFSKHVSSVPPVGIRDIDYRRG